MCLSSNSQSCRPRLIPSPSLNPSPEHLGKLKDIVYAHADSGCKFAQLLMSKSWKACKYLAETGRHRFREVFEHAGIQILLSGVFFLNSFWCF